MSAYDDRIDQARIATTRRPQSFTYAAQIVAPIWTCSHRHRSPHAAHECARTHMAVEGLTHRPEESPDESL